MGLFIVVFPLLYPVRGGALGVAVDEQHFTLVVGLENRPPDFAPAALATTAFSHRPEQS